ncbi:DUF4347 domain-containing protein [Pseudomonas sp. BCA14]|uniref:Ig-like domain-containing protein n=1 Tax=unclassified Pseudomonas TaxID=196821 RepID=UPI00106EE061|nr:MULTISPECIES: Ig-like domain-containing protein [unclassified Pseudomonas]TFF04724.1 DUF4347 domain-containing protein [Pseudomonas sp. JMN1]TFF06202.1 DUF4347 domain-containing protein [Pseudomonas sp. BCA17]TFF22191.1 DUF4347 domain-containing protein [Pseudomonas sp. BCA14]TFF26588.1 DUF4347 domain-containing protein [Pseudomonas sp. BCA13]
MWWSKGKARQAATGANTLATPMIMFLEPRMLFDGAVAATVVDAAQVDSHATADAAAKAPAAEHPSASKDTHGQTDAPATSAPVAVPGQTVVFVDARVKDSAELLKGAAPGTQVVQLDASKDGLQQIADYLGSHQGVSSVQLIAHGNTGDLWLGSTYLSADNVSARSEVLAQIGQDMNVGGDILIYACNTAEGTRGLAFVDSLAQLTGRDIAASSNRTGGGGDWTLEIATGSIESHTALSYQAMSAYQYGLATITVTNNSDIGAGSLRQALSDSVAGDTVTFSSSMTVNLNSQLIITKNVTVEGDLNRDGAADVTLSGQYKTQVLRVNSGVTATLDGLVITQGLVAGNGAQAGVDGTAAMGGGIANFGNLTLNNVTVTSNAASGGGGGGGVTAPYAGGAVGGGGGGGGALGGQNGGRGGSSGMGTGVYAGTAGSSNHGGTGGSYNPSYMGGKGGSNVGGAGGMGVAGYSNGGSGGTANNGIIAIGGGGGGSGWDRPGRAGASASGGIYNATTGTLTVVGTSVISNNIAAGGGGGGGGGSGGGSADPGGAAGKGVGAIWNKGTLLMTAANFAAMSGNIGGSGSGGQAAGGGATGASVAATNNIFNDGGTLNTAYAPAPTATIVVSNAAQHLGSTSLVTITFNQAVTGFTNADLTVANGTLSAVSSSDGGTTWTATFTPSSSTTSATNHIVLDNTGVASVSTGTVGSGTTASNNYSIDTVRPTATVSVVAPTLSTTVNSTVNITFSEAVSGFTLSDMTASNGTLSNLATSDNIHWTATLTPTASNSSTGNVITLDNTLYTDTATNTGTGTTTSNTYAIDTQRPTATIVVADPVLSAGETTLVTITFSEAVTGFTNSDLSVPNGILSTVSSSDGGVTWTATFTPTAGINDATNVITLANTGVADLAGNAGSGTTSSANYTIDTVQPTATIVVGDNALKVGETSLVTITFSEAVSGFTNADLTIANGTLSAVSSSDGGVTWTATFTPTNNITDASNLITLDNGGVQNASGNTGSGTTTSNNYAIDTQRPTANIVVADTALGIGQTSLVTITFSEAVTGFTNADLTIANGTLSAVSSSDGGITWTATFTPAAGITDTSNVITLDNTGTTDLAGNAGSGTTDSNNYAVDSQRPTATIVVADSALTAGETSLVTITFSEAVTGFTNADLTVANGTLTAVSSSDGGITWTATFTPTAGINDATNVITLANTGVADLAGNAGSGTTNSANYTIDTVQPTATIVVGDNALKAGETSLVTITFSEAVTGFTNADLTIANGTLSAVSSSDGGVTWTATFTPTNNITDSSNLITLDNGGVQNASGNTGSGTTTSNNYAIDTQRPTATIVVADTALGIGQTSLVTVTFSEAVSGFSNADLIVANGTLSGLGSSDGGITWTATFTPEAGITDTSNTVRLNNSGVQDAAGNSGIGTTDSNSYAIDTQRPTATIVIANPDLNVGRTSLVTVTFSEPVTGFDNRDLLISNGTLTALASADGGRTWTGVLTPYAGFDTTDNVISLNNGGIQDLAGNTGVGSTLSNTYDVHTSRPIATIEISDPVLGKFERQFVTIRFSTPVFGFNLASLQAANGTFSELTQYGSTLYSVLFTPNADTTVANNVITLDTSTVRDAHGNAGVGTAVSPAFAVDTVLPTATLTLSDTLLEPGETAIVTVTFSEQVTGFDNNAIINLRSATLSTFYSPDGGMTWRATLTPTPGAGSSGSYLIGLSMAYVQDLAGNSNYGLPMPMVSYQVDHAPLTSSVYVDSQRLTSNGPTTVHIYFNKPVTNFDLSDLSADNGVLSNLRSSDGGVSWQATLTPFANITSDQNVVRLNNVGVTYNGGSIGLGITTSGNYTVDTQRPTSTIVIDKTSLALGDQATVTITFSEAVEFYNNPQAQNAWLSGLKTVDGGITWTATLTPQGYIEDTSNIVTLDNTRVHDLNGNAGLGTSTSNNYTIDTRPPTATIVVDKDTLAGGDTANVTITFSEAVSGLKLDNLRVSSGVLSNLKSVDGGVTWTATLTPEAHLQSWMDLVVLDGQGVKDAAGNTGQSYTYSNYFHVDTQGPQVYIEVSDTQLKAGQGTEVFIWFSEPVRGFDLSSLRVQNGTLSNLQSGEGGYYWTATLTPNNNVNAGSNVISVDNSTIRDLAGNAGAGVSESNSYAINSISVTADPLTLTGGIARPVIDPPHLPLQPGVFAPPTGNLGSPLTFAPLFEQRVLGDGIRPLGDIFINNGATSPSFIAQVFTSSDNVGDGSGEGFLGFGGGDGGIFGSSTLSSLFNRETHGDDSALKAFDGKPINGQGDPAQGLRGVFGAPSLGQQLQQLKDTEQRQVMDLAHALQQVGISEMQA